MYFYSICGVVMLGLIGAIYYLGFREGKNFKQPTVIEKQIDTKVEICDDTKIIKRIDRQERVLEELWLNNF